MMAYCGLLCDTCPIHLATLETDPAIQRSMRKSIAEICNQQYNMKLKAKEITDCDGCLTNTGRIFQGCLDCEIKICAQQKDLENCGWCKHYPCNKLNPVFSEDEEARARLDAIKNRIN